MRRILCGLILCAGLLNTQSAIAQTENKTVTDSAIRKLDAPGRDSASAASRKPDTASITGIPIVDSFVGDIKAPLRSKPLSFRAVAIPTGMIVFGASALASNNLKKVNLYARDEFWTDRNGGYNQRKTKIDNYTIHAPAVAVYALNLAGIKGKHNFVDRSVIFVMANVISNGLVFSTKEIAGIQRPDSSNYHSFPSGHTAQAFVSAEFLRQEYKDVSPWIGVAGYAVAIGSGAMRMYNNKHWLNDVIAGAGVGILSTRLSYWIYPKVKNAVLRKARGNSTVILPTYQNGAVGVGLVHNF